MTSPGLVSLKDSLQKLREALIAERDESLSYSRADHDRALGFRVLASAHLEDYAERRCLEAVESARAKLVRGQISRTAKCLLIWNSVRSETQPIPLELADFSSDMESAVKSYEKLIKRMHGISGRNFKAILMPLGLRDPDFDSQLFDKLDELAQKRGAAAHVRVNRAKTMTEPAQEWQIFDDLLPLLEELDMQIANASS
ncbi:HEPN domain-containing protein [Rhodococcus sp. IEGM1428]|uniref:HEPN domain-containing protein n=1 Tax=Rhodococcus sp. IEGM1428 TaxID=3392191 RepID=UPI003D116379